MSRKIEMSAEARKWIRKADPSVAKLLRKKISKTTRTVQRALNTLVAKGYIQREGSKNNHSWKIIP